MRKEHHTKNFYPVRMLIREADYQNRNPGRNLRPSLERMKRALKRMELNEEEIRELLNY